MIEDRMSILYSEGVAEERITLNQFVDVTSTRAAKLFGLYPKKGTIAVGSDADLVIFDPFAVRTISAATHHMKVDYNAFEGKQVKGIVRTVLSKGKVIIKDQLYKGKVGDGQYIKRSKYNEQLRNQTYVEQV